MVRTGLGGSIPGAPDSGGGSSDSSSGGGSGVDPADEFGRELGGDPAESGGSNTGAPADPADEFGPELGGDPAESAGSNTGAPAPSDGGPSGGSSSGGGSSTGGSGGGPLDTVVEEVLNPGAQAFSERVAAPAGDISRAISPAAQVADRVAPNAGVGRSRENFVESGVNSVNPFGIAAGGIRAGQATASAVERTAQGDGSDVIDDIQRRARGALASAATSVRQDPVGSISTGAGAVVGGALFGSAAARGARAAGSRAASGGGSSTGTAVRTGRSNVGTGGTDNIFDADTLDELTGATGASRASRVRGSVDRATADARETIEDVAGDFLGDRRAQTGTFRRPDSDTGAPDRFTDFDGEDRVSDNLVQQSLNRQQRAGREVVDDGGFELGRDAFGPGTRRGTISERGDVELTRSTASPDIDTGTGTDVGGFDTGFGAPAAGAGLGTLASVNDPTGIADFGAAGGGGDAGAAGAVGSDATGELDGVNDPTGIATTVGTGTGSTSGGSTTGTPGDGDLGSGLDTDSDTAAGTRPSERTTIGTTQAPGAVTDGESATGLTAAPSTAETGPFATPRAAQGATGVSPPGSNTPRRARGEEEEPDDDDPAGLGLQLSTADFDSGILGGGEASEQTFGR